MEDCLLEEKKKRFLKKFDQCRPVLSAIGDETRLLIIKVLIQQGWESGMRVREIQKYTNISRTAVSHHLKLLKNSGIIAVRREGTKNYYYVDPYSCSLHFVVDFWNEAKNMINLFKENVEHH